MKPLMMVSIVLILMTGITAGCLTGKNPAAAGIAPRFDTVGNLTLIYPRVQGLGIRGDKINQAIQQEISRFSAEHSQPDHSGQIGYKVEYNRSQLLSVRLKESFYVTHAAHPMSYLRTFNYSTQTGSQLALADLFRPGQDFLPRLNELAKKQLDERQAVLLRPYSGVTANQEFYLTDNALVLYYQLYEFTPYVYGFLELSIPYRELGGLLRPELAP